MKPLKAQYDEAAKKLASTLERRDAQAQLALLRSTVQSFRDEGFEMAMEVRPDKIGNTVFSETYGYKMLFNGELQAEGQRIDFAILKSPDVYGEMQFKMSWGGDTQLSVVSAFSMQQRPPGWVARTVSVAGAPADAGDEYGDDPAPLPVVKPVEQGIREVLVNVLAKAGAAAQYNIAPEAGTGKSFKVPAQIKLAKDKTP